ncbi:pentapeptide repeat-containing protein [Kordiimonas gwangyangensis]|uniref:pentapeptide repeat-containing protein n=1 Tax=Kordiimonas gwangyangensis TaxID=288022 RepID=UPI000472E71B|nr:pentapeptide repeat-containing protein [Kordiimonas gwangyangensis]
MAEKNTNSEPEYVDAATGKPIVYADNVPEILRGLTQDSFGVELHDPSMLRYNNESYKGKLAEGSERWNEWVQWAELKNARWLTRTEKDRCIEVRLKTTENLVEFEGDGRNRYNIRNGVFSGFVFPFRVSFGCANFVGDTYFEAAVFCQDVSFEKTEFGGDTFFADAVFWRSADFAHMTVQGRFEAGKTSFHGTASFNGAKFLRDAMFSQSHFNGTTHFHGSKFHGIADFSQRTFFHKEAFFNQASFQRRVDFSRSEFRGVCNFVQNTIFNGIALFEKAKFHGGTNFTASFTSEALFTQARFKRSAIFLRSNFTVEATFTKALFTGDASFSMCVFQSSASFEGVVFDRCAHISSRFMGRLNFSSALFMGEADWTDCSVEMAVNFNDSQFLGVATFANTTFGGYANFDGVMFGKGNTTSKSLALRAQPVAAQEKYILTKMGQNSMTVPDFKGTHFKIPPNLGYTEVAVPVAPYYPNWSPIKNIRVLFSEDSQTKDADAASKLRRLQELAAAGHHHLAEKRFFRAELLCRRGHEASTWPEITMINLFELFSGCGLSVIRPVLWLLGLIVVCGMVYFSQIDWTFAEMNSDGESWFDLVSYSVLNSLPLIGYASDTYGVSVDVLFGGIANVPWFVKLTAFFQNIASAVLLFFALLAIRNYFKLG